MASREEGGRGSRGGRGLGSEERGRGSTRGRGRGSWDEGMESTRERIQGTSRRGRDRSEHKEGRFKETKEKYIGYGRLVSWAESKDPGQLVLWMCTDREALSRLLQKENMKEDWYELLIKALSFAILAQHQKESVKQLLETVMTTKCFQSLLSDFLLNKNISGGSWVQAELFFNNVTNIIAEVLLKLPSFSKKCVMTANLLSSNIQTLDEVCDNHDLIDRINHLLERSKQVTVKENEEDKQRNRGIRHDSDVPPEDFGTLSVIPKPEDIMAGVKPFVRKAVTCGTYADLNHYLDIQFRLMREDFIQPLREGLSEFRKADFKKNHKCSDLRLYYGVKIIGMVSHDGIDHVLQFDISGLKTIKWEYSKRFIFGSLLCLSKDNFETMIFATVSHRDPNDLKKGNVNVSFQTNLKYIFSCSVTDEFVMAESAAYFESYKHVLEGLQEMVHKRMPLQEYILSCRQELKPPRYILEKGTIVAYDLSCMMRPLGSKNSSQVFVLNTLQWPHVDKMCLNSSQREAAQLALTKEFALIQGPPGTGKTYVGLKVIEVLLKNRSPGGTDKDEHAKSPILVVCYTNHALDQFLEGVLQFCPKGIVRVGGKNSSELLKQFNIKSIKQDYRRKNVFLGLSVRNSRRDCLFELNSTEEKIQHLHKRINSLSTEIQEETILEDVMKPEHFHGLQRKPLIGHRTAMGTWLNASNDEVNSVLPKLLWNHTAKLILNGKSELSDSHLTGKIQDVPIHIKARVYKYWLNRYMRYLQGQMILQAQNKNYRSQVWCRDMMTLAGEEILDDKDICQVIPEQCYLKIKQYVYSSCPNKVDEHTSVVKYWLLNQYKSPQKQMDDIQILRSLQNEENGMPLTFDDDDDDDDTQQEHRSRMIDDDGDSEGEEYLTNAKKVKNSHVSLMQRAKMLGIEDDMYEDDDNDGQGNWIEVRHTKPLNLKMIEKKLATVKPMDEEEEENILDVWSIDLNKRFSLYNLWVKRQKEKLNEDMIELIDKYKSALEKKKEINAEDTLQILRDAKVIGMTTTGAAKHRLILQAVGCEIIIVEEAAEVLEAHIVTALNKNCKHLILIGDHQQLRPNPTVYELAKWYSLDISLFERLINNKVPHVTLKEQHRMRPSISKIMRHIYPELQDHCSVLEYDHVKGVQKDIFFINHKHEEAQDDETRSKSNKHEAEFVVAFYKYLLQQGYTASQITILATYTGQILAIKNTMKAWKAEKGVRVTSVDNFQGEENDIILLSLVRSNVQKNVGFLKVDNRVCVALSRAKKGMFAIGNFDTLASQSNLWKKIVKTSEEEEIIGEGLPLICQNHPRFQISVEIAKDFEKCPEGGCGRPCTFRLDCGHVCKNSCHSYDPMHKEYRCTKPCGKMCKEGHPCRKQCYQQCGVCDIQVCKVIPSCGHTDKVPCHIPAGQAECLQRCSVVLDCLHQCPGKCGTCRRNRKHSQCNQIVSYAWPCGHISDVPCYQKPAEYPCSKPCGTKLDCGHLCAGKCEECLQGAVHIACKEKCLKALPCGHTCGSFCSTPCKPCEQLCPTRCRHSLCSTYQKKKNCGDLCEPCQEQCSHRCYHGKCEQKCFQKCSKVPCNEKCTRIIKCKSKGKAYSHKCSGLCGELCVCAKCAKIHPINGLGEKSTTDSLEQLTSEKKFDQTEEKYQGASVPGADENVKTNELFAQDSATKVFDENEDVEKVPSKNLLLKIPSCQHVFYVQELDKYVEKFGTDDVSFIKCPVCPIPISNCMRYANKIQERFQRREVLKKELIDGMMVSKPNMIKLRQSQLMFDTSTDFRSLVHKMENDCTPVQSCNIPAQLLPCI